LPTEDALAGAKRLVEVMETIDYPSPACVLLGGALGALGERLPAAQAEAGARHLLTIMAATSDWEELSALGWALGALGKQLPGREVEASALRIVDVMRTTMEPKAFRELAKPLGALPVPANPDLMHSAVDLLQSPMAFGDTRTLLLIYYSRLAGVHDTAEAFASTNDLVAWLREHRPSLNLSRPPHNPFTAGNR
jgi:hypothetical protein